MEKLESLNKEELEKRKLIQEIKQIQKPIWRNTSFISVIGSLTLTFIAIVISIWQIKNNKISELESAKENLRQKTEEVNTRENLTRTQYIKAIAEKAIVQSEKANAISERTQAVQQFKNWQLSMRESELKSKIKKFGIINEELKKKSAGYKRGFIESYVQNNSAVRVDIEKYSTPQNRVEFEQWMKEQLLWTALSKYESYIFSQTTNASLQGL
jgi:hypothetical protein